VIKKNKNKGIAHCAKITRITKNHPKNYPIKE
jgi:hypothetical protein